jgi:hypothetical protein
VIAYYGYSSDGFLGVYHCTTASCSSGDDHQIDNPATVLVAISLAIGTDGYPVVAYQDFTDKKLKLVHCTNYECSTKEDPVFIDDPGTQTNSGGYTSLAIGTDGYPVISYYDDDNNHLKIAKGLGFPTTAAAYFGNGVAGDKQIKFKSDTTNSQFLQAVSSIEDGLKYWFDEVGYNRVASDDAIRDPMTASAGSSPAFSFTEKFSSVPTALYPRWYGRSDVAASAKNIILQVFRFGSTNQWVDVATDSTCSANTDCVIKSSITSTLSEYFLPRYNYDSTKKRKRHDARVLELLAGLSGHSRRQPDAPNQHRTLGQTDTTTSGTRGDAPARRLLPVTLFPKVKSSDSNLNEKY